jgi:hypothetical protein
MDSQQQRVLAIFGVVSGSPWTVAAFWDLSPPLPCSPVRGGRVVLPEEIVK